MEGEDQEGAVGGDQALTSFNISEAELIGLQQGGGLGSLAGQDSAEHLSQGDLEALASIQDELDRMSSGQSNIISEEIVMGGGGSGLATSLQGDQVLVQAPAFDQNGLELSTLGAAEPQLVSPTPGLRHTVRVVKRPASGAQGGGVKVRGVEAGSLGSGGQFRIVNTSQAFSLGGQQVRLVNAGTNLKTIAPSEASSSMGNISIVNQDGSFTTLPIGTPMGGPGIRIVSGGTTQGVVRPGVRAQPIQPHPGTLAQPLRILPSQMSGNFKILNRDGSLSEISSSFIRPKSDLNPIPSVASSPKKKNVTYSNIAIKSPQKVITLKPPEGGPGQVIRTADGRLISLQGAAKKVVLPVASSSGANVLPLQQTFSPTKIVIKDSQGNNVQTVSAGQTRGVGQLLRLEQASEKVQYVRVVNSAGKSQTMPIRALGAEVGIQGVTVRPAGGQVEIRTSVSATAGVSSLSSLPDAGRQEELQETAPAKEKPRAATASMEPHGVRPRKPCNCTKSQCLKLYCDCFANGEFCNNCNCTGCMNNLSNEDERQRSIKQCLDRNPNAFKPKIGKNTSEGERRHNKGCNCKRSGCLKNYCECYEAKIPCTNHCKCLGCKNVDNGGGGVGSGSQAANHSAAAGGFKLEKSEAGQQGAPGQGLNLGERWFKPSTSLRSKLLQAPTPLDGDDKGLGGARQPFSFVSQEVVEATCQCLLAQAEEGEKKGKSIEQIERIVLEEFGRCLVQIIDFAGKAKKS